MIVKSELKPDDMLTENQIKEIDDASALPVSFDDDCPELTKEMYEELRKVTQRKKKERRKQIISIRVSKEAVEKAKLLGDGYTSVLGRVIEDVVNEPDILKKYL